LAARLPWHGRAAASAVARRCYKRHSWSCKGVLSELQGRVARAARAHRRELQAPSMGLDASHRRSFKPLLTELLAPSSERQNFIVKLQAPLPELQFPSDGAAKGGRRSYKPLSPELQRAVGGATSPCRQQRAVGGATSLAAGDANIESMKLQTPGYRAAKDTAMCSYGAAAMLPARTAVLPVRTAVLSMRAAVLTAMPRVGTESSTTGEGRQCSQDGRWWC
jgi:hypothetical protein